MKFVDVKEVFAEIPDEITLAISISGCPIQCKGCHSQYLWEDTGQELTPEVLSTLLDQHFGVSCFLRKHLGVSCLCFMGGDQDPAEVNRLAQWTKQHSKVKTAWYSGRATLSRDIDLQYFDYIKIGPYVEEQGPLNVKTTNQRLYRVVDGQLTDITARFWNRLV